MLSEDVARYVALHRSLGYRFRVQAGLLGLYARFAEARGDQTIRTATALAWAGEAPSPQQRRNRLLVLRRLALALRAEDAAHELPPVDAFGRAVTERHLPHIYSDEEIAILLQAAAALAPTGGLRPVLYVTLFGLLAATGLRISEALALRLDDLTEDGLLVRETKFRKSRLVPLHDTTAAALARYLGARRRHRAAGPFLLVAPGGPLPYDTASGTFRQLARKAGLRGAPGTDGPRIHDLRHTFAVRSLEACAGVSGAEVARHMVALSTYLGHARVTDTQWYLHATPALMAGIAAAGEANFRGGMP
ncbi:tyrosine-type recombinase/integrase [Roseomonas chloroacetimidivorans]|uniref:tyrosine-type recombinase/integrase n=1 Tax=Roseomonas chloroacetimidivorans TaxID=1766656 RepID=UPI003C73F9C6